MDAKNVRKDTEHSTRFCYHEKEVSKKHFSLTGPKSHRLSIVISRRLTAK